MSRDHRKLDVFNASDALVLDIYRSTNEFPIYERYGLQAQIRRAAVSVSSNIVEGSARRSTRDYVNFLNIAAGSASETRYLATLAARLGYIPVEAGQRLEAAYTSVCAQLVALIHALESKP